MKLPFPAQVLETHTATLGKTGSGKSSANRVIAEYLLDKKQRVCIVDPKGDWWGLKTSADGKGPGYPVICFGDFKDERATDIPINDRAGREVAELVCSGNRPCVIGFRGWSTDAMNRFYLEFIQVLYAKNSSKLFCFLGEVQNFAPKAKIFDPTSGRVIHWTNKILSEGRGLGFSFFIDSQRPQKVHNDTLDNCETLIAMRTVHPAARSAIAEWMKGAGDLEKSKAVLDTLASLKRGEAWVWSPENAIGPERVQFPMFSTFDSFAPPGEQKQVSKAGWSTVDLAAVKEKLANVIEEHKANDPQELKAEINRLKAENRKLAASNHHVATAMPSKEELDKATAAAVRTAVIPYQKHIAEIQNQVSRIYARTEAATQYLNDVLTHCTAIVRKDPPAFTILPPTQEPAPRTAARSLPRPAPASIPGTNGGPSIGERKILTAAAQFQGVEKEQLTVLTGYKSTSRNEYVKRLIAAGLAEKRSDGKIYATDAGIAAIGRDYEALPTGRALYEWWKPRLSAGELRILSYLVDQAHGRELEKTALTEPTGLKSTSINEYIKRLAARRLVVSGPNRIRAAETLFDSSL